MHGVTRTGMRGLTTCVLQAKVKTNKEYMEDQGCAEAFEMKWDDD